MEKAAEQLLDDCQTFLISVGAATPTLTLKLLACKAHRCYLSATERSGDHLDAICLAHAGTKWRSACNVERIGLSRATVLIAALVRHFCYPIILISSRSS